MQSKYEIWSLTVYTVIAHHLLLKRKPLNFFFTYKPEEKQGEVEQREELESDLAEVASQAEESPSIPTEDKEPPQNQETVKEDIATETHQTVSKPSPTRTHSGRGRHPKTAPISAQKKIPVKKEEESAAQDAPGFQDDPSDADYAPSKYIFIECNLICPLGVFKVHMMH